MCYRILVHLSESLPIPLLEIFMFFLTWYYTINRGVNGVGLVKHDYDVHLINSYHNYYFFYLCKTKQKKDENISNSGVGKDSLGCF